MTRGRHVPDLVTGSPVKLETSRAGAGREPRFRRIQRLKRPLRRLCYQKDAARNNCRSTPKDLLHRHFLLR